MEGDLRWCCGSSSSNDWDLHAVVRLACSCSGGSRVTSPLAASDESFSCLPPHLTTTQSQKDDEVTDAAALQQLPIGRAVVDDFCLQQAFFATPAPQPRNEAPPQQPPAKLRSKRKKKKSQLVSKKEVRRVPVGGASPADPWSWRKYGQKPIKGSPYPRGYYRCSTDKDCRARKQVERCRTDPSTLIVSYTGGEHSHPVPLHRNALAGTTRNKPPQPTSSSSISPAEQPPPPAASPIDDTTTPLLSPSVGVEYEEEVLLEDGEMEEEEEDVLSLFLKRAPSPASNGSGGYDSKYVDLMLLPEPHRPAPGADSARGSEQVSKLHEFTLPATTSSSRMDDGSGGGSGGHERHRQQVPFLRPNAVGGCSGGGGDQLGLSRGCIHRS